MSPLTASIVEPLLALVPPPPIRAALREPLTLISDVRAMTLGEICSIRALLPPVPGMIVAPIRIVRPRGNGRGLATLSCERARRHTERRCQRHRHDQG